MDKTEFDKGVEIARQVMADFKEQCMQTGSYEGMYAAWHERIALELHQQLPPCDFIFSAAPLIRRSKTDKVAWNALKGLARIYLDADVLPPNDLKQWILDVLDGKLPTPTGKQPDPEILIRNGGAMLAVKTLVDMGWQASRNKGRLNRCCAEGGSAVDAVGDALNLGFSTMDNIWNGRP